MRGARSADTNTPTLESKYVWRVRVACTCGKYVWRESLYVSGAEWTLPHYALRTPTYSGRGFIMRFHVQDIAGQRALLW